MRRITVTLILLLLVFLSFFAIIGCDTDNNESNRQPGVPEKEGKNVVDDIPPPPALPED